MIFDQSETQVHYEREKERSTELQAEKAVIAVRIEQWLRRGPVMGATRQ